MNRRNALRALGYGGAIASGVVIGAVAASVPYVKPLVETVTKTMTETETATYTVTDRETITKTETSTLTSTATKTETSTQTKTQTQTITLQPPTLESETVGKTPGQAYNFNVDITLANPQNPIPISGVLCIPEFPDGSQPVTLSMKQIGDNRYSADFLSTKPGGHSLVILPYDKSTRPVTAARITPADDSRLNLAITQDERNSLSNPKLVDYVFPIQLNTQDNFVRSLDQENLFAQSIYPILASRLGINDASAKTLVYYGAGTLNKYSRHPLASINTFLDDEDETPVLGDVSPLIVPDTVRNTNVTVQTSDPSRDTWFYINTANQRLDTISQRQKREGFNRRMEQISWSLFENPYRPERYDGIAHSPTDSDVQDVILGIHDEMSQIPEILQSYGLEIPFPFHDSDLLKQNIARDLDREIALRYLEDVAAVTYDKSTQKVVKGIAAMKLIPQQMKDERNTLLKVITNPDSDEYARAIIGYYDWLIDRGRNGLSNTVGQFIGDWTTFNSTWNDAFQKFDYHTQPRELVQYVENQIGNKNGIDQHLSRDLQFWKSLIKPTYGYERSKSDVWGGEWPMSVYGLPVAFKSLGIPYSPSGDFYDQLGGYGFEWGTYGIPDKNLNSLTNGTYGQVVKGNGNGFALPFCVDGVNRDLQLGPSNGGATSINVYQKLFHDYDFWPIEGQRIYLWKKS